MAINDKLNRIKEIKEDIKQALIDKGVDVTDEDSFASYADKITNIPQEGGGDPYYEDLYNLRTGNGTNMDGLFARAISSDSLDLTGLDVSQCTSMRYMFENCYIPNLDLSGWDLSNVTDMSHMFRNCQSTNINMTGWDTSKVNNMSNMLYTCRAASVIIPFLNTDSVTDMSYMFSEYNEPTLDLSHFNTFMVNNMNGIFSFAYNSEVKNLIIPNWDMTNTTLYGSMFGYGTSYIPNLKYIDLSNSNELTVNRILSSLPTKTEAKHGSIVIPADSSQELIDTCIAKYWKPIGPSLNVESFQITSELDEVRPGQKTKIICHSPLPWYSSIPEVEFISSDESIATVNENGEITAVSLGSVEIYARLKDNPDVISNTISFTVAEVDSTPYVIKFKSAASTPISSAYYVKVNGNEIKLNTMDYNPYTEIYTCDVGQEITSVKFDSAYSMISDLIKLDFNGNNIQSLSINSGYIKSIDTTSWDTSNITNMNNMFDSCTSVSTIDASNWDTSNVTSMSFLFQNCTSLTMLDLTSWDTSQVSGTFYMFKNVPSTCQIYVGPNWTLTEEDCSFTGTFIRTNKLTINYQDSYEPYNNPYVEFSTTVANENSKRCYLTEETEFGRRGHIYLPNNETYWIYCSNNNESWGTLSSSITLESDKEIWIVRGEPYYFEEEPNNEIFTIDSDSLSLDWYDNRNGTVWMYLKDPYADVSFSTWIEEKSFNDSNLLNIQVIDNGGGSYYFEAQLSDVKETGSATAVIREEVSGYEQRITIYISEGEPMISSFSINPDSLTFSEDNKTAVVDITLLADEIGRRANFDSYIYARSSFETQIEQTETGYKLTITATQLYKEEWDVSLQIYETRSGISSNIPVIVESENIYVDPNAYINVRYYRPDETYNEEATIICDSGESGGSTSFYGSDGYGKKALVTVTKGIPYTFTIIDGDFVATGEFTFNENGELWILYGDTTIHTEYVEGFPKIAEVNVYYHKSSGDYTGVNMGYYSSEYGGGGTDYCVPEGEWVKFWAQCRQNTTYSMSISDNEFYASGEFTFTEDTNLWVIEGDSTIYTEKPGTEEPENPYYVEYTIAVADDCTETVGYANTSGTPYLPKINDEIPTNVTIKLKDGTTTTNLDTLAKDVESIKVDYDENTQKVIFGYSCSTTNCSKISGINYIYFSNKITDMSNMFYNCSLLTSLDVSNWDTSNVTNTAHMFRGCSSLTSLDVSNWDTSNVTNMGYVFQSCSSLTSLDVSNWDTSNVEYMMMMFRGCSSLTSLDVSNWDTSNVTNTASMFKSVPADCQIIVGSNWTLTETGTGFAGTFTRV